MGCVGSKKAAPVTPAFDSSGDLAASAAALWTRPRLDGDRSESGESAAEKLSFTLGSLHGYIEGEQVAAGWPAWLSAVAGEAIHGWVPLKSDSFEKLEKIGQGTYSSVFKARDLDTGRMVALKKVHFDNVEPESVRFMAREILILRRLNHPNIIRLEGLITSRFSSSIFLVFEYMEHDLAGLSSSPDIKFSESQIKCYMHQLLSGLEHCHSRGVMHRDIKCANLLVNNEGIVKIADFGLANFFTPGHKQPLTSRVVTLWYRPPELLLGSTDYEPSIDLWSVGCVFAEMFLGKPILQGRTEVEQIHKIFKLCGSPTDDFWQKSKISHATVFKPQQPYENRLRETFNFLPESVLKLLETLLSVEPCKRGTATSALTSEYFMTKPYACDPASMPKYAPNKEIDAKNREDLRRRNVGSQPHVADATRRLSRIYEDGGNSIMPSCPEGNGPARLFVDLQPMPAINPRGSQGDIAFSGPLCISTSAAWSKKPKEELSGSKPHALSSGSRNHKNTSNTKRQGSDAKGHETYEDAKQAILKQWKEVDLRDSLNACNAYDRDPDSFKTSILNQDDHGVKVEFSGPLLHQSHKVDEILEKHERHIRQAVRKSWFQKRAKARTINLQTQ